MSNRALVEEEAKQRATSVYLVDRVVPMLPERLSNHICSLNPSEDKLTYSAVFEINEKSEVINEWFGRTIMNSDKRFSYSEAQQVIDTGDGDMKDQVAGASQAGTAAECKTICIRSFCI